MQLWLNRGPGLHQRWRDFGSEEKSLAQQKRSCCTGDGSSKFHSSHQPGSLFFAGSSSFSREMDAHCAATWVSNSDWPVFFSCHCNLKCRRDCRFISPVFYLAHVHIYKYCMAHKHVFTRLSSAWKVPLTGSLSQPLHENHITAWRLSNRSKYGRGTRNEREHDRKRFWVDSFSETLASFPWSHLPTEGSWYFFCFSGLVALVANANFMQLKHQTYRWNMSRTLGFGLGFLWFLLIRSFRKACQKPPEEYSWNTASSTTPSQNCIFMKNTLKAQSSPIHSHTRVPFPNQLIFSPICAFVQLLPQHRETTFRSHFCLNKPVWGGSRVHCKSPINPARTRSSAAEICAIPPCISSVLIAIFHTAMLTGATTPSGSRTRRWGGGRGGVAVGGEWVQLGFFWVNVAAARC